MTLVAVVIIFSSEAVRRQWGADEWWSYEEEDTGTYDGSSGRYDVAYHPPQLIHLERRCCGMVLSQYPFLLVHLLQLLCAPWGILSAISIQQGILPAISIQLLASEYILDDVQT